MKAGRRWTLLGQRLRREFVAKWGNPVPPGSDRIRELARPLVRHSDIRLPLQMNAQVELRAWRVARSNIHLPASHSGCSEQHIIASSAYVGRTELATRKRSWP